MAFFSFFKKIFYSIRTWWQHDPLYNSFRNRRGGKWVLGYNDWKQLERIMHTYQPALILELGTGIGGSTACIARASQDAKIVTVEQFERCIRTAQSLIPKEYQSRIEFLQRNITIRQLPDIAYRYFLTYESLPHGKWDMVLVDGPGPILEKERLINLLGVDLIALIPQLKNGCLVYIDGRRELVDIIKRFHNQYFDTLDDTNRFVLLRRNSEPFRGTDDLLLKKLTAQGYFDEN